MKNEIEEIINNLQRIADRKCYPEDILDGSIAQEWVDYITNLQEENEQNRKKITVYEAILEEKNDTIDYYKSIIKEAIEYINKNKHLSMFADCREPEEDWNYELEIDPRDLLNILNGDNK